MKSIPHASSLHFTHMKQSPLADPIAHENKRRAFASPIAASSVMEEHAQIGARSLHPQCCVGREDTARRFRSAAKTTFLVVALLLSTSLLLPPLCLNGRPRRKHGKKRAIPCARTQKNSLE
jgi:hypothetical protein